MPLLIALVREKVKYVVSIKTAFTLLKFLNKSNGVIVVNCKHKHIRTHTHTFAHTHPHTVNIKPNGISSAFVGSITT